MAILEIYGGLYAKPCMDLLQIKGAFIYGCSGGQSIVQETSHCQLYNCSVQPQKKTENCDYSTYKLGEKSHGLVSHDIVCIYRGIAYI